MTLGLFGLAIVLIVGVVLVVIGALGWVDVGPFYHSTRL